jgi:hypothetical protein
VKLDPQTQRALDKLGDEFTVRALRHESERRENLDALVELGATLTRMRRYAEGLMVDMRLARLRPEEPIVHYNLACSLALVGRGDEALDELERAVDLGYEDCDHLVKDKDLRSLRGTTRFDDLVKRLKELESGPAPGPEIDIPD